MFKYLTLLFILLFQFNVLGQSPGLKHKYQLGFSNGYEWSTIKIRDVNPASLEVSGKIGFSTVFNAGYIIKPWLMVNSGLGFNFKRYAYSIENLTAIQNIGAPDYATPPIDIQTRVFSNHYFVPLTVRYYPEKEFSSSDFVEVGVELVYQKDAGTNVKKRYNDWTNSQLTDHKPRFNIGTQLKVGHTFWLNRTGNHRLDLALTSKGYFKPFIVPESYMLTAGIDVAFNFLK